MMKKILTIGCILVAVLVVYVILRPEIFPQKQPQNEGTSAQKEVSLKSEQQSNTLWKIGSNQTITWSGQQPTSDYDINYILNLDSTEGAYRITIVKNATSYDWNVGTAQYCGEYGCDVVAVPPGDYDLTVTRNSQNSEEILVKHVTIVP